MNIDALSNALLNCEMKYDIYQNTFSPNFSSYGLQFDGDFAGIKALYLHYNRSTRPTWDEFMLLPGKVTEYTPRADSVKIKTAAAESTVAFYSKDCFSVACTTNEPVEFFVKAGEKLGDIWALENDESSIIIQGYSQNGDDRDPDKFAPITVGLKVIKGTLKADEKSVFVEPENGEIYVGIAADVLNVDADIIKSRLAKAPDNISKAIEFTRSWINECIKELDVRADDSRDFTVFIKALITLIFNLTEASGNLEGCISSFPNRGGYPTHFMWDSCFQNLAYENMNMNIAKDSLLQLCNNIRRDGKIPQFICSTWSRPHDAQPALLGWAAKRIYDKESDVEFIGRIFEALEKNNLWWLTARMTRFGIISCADGLETGQDNSPRFDNGAVLAVDMNSYLLNQLKVTAEFAKILGFEDKAMLWAEKAKELDRNMIKWLYDEDKNLFFDADALTGVKQTLLTASGFIPLWAEVSIPKAKADDMIKSWLLNPKYFYGDVPFPSVAYTEKVYDASDWWRGPTWMPEAWLMLETLKKYGFETDYENSAKTLFEVLLKDGVLHELFNSETCEGMGNVEQGWTAAIYIALFMLFNT